MHRIIGFVVLLAVSASAVEAREVMARSFEQLRLLARLGDEVTVTETGGREVRGIISDLSSSSLVLLVDGGQRVLGEPEVRTIRRHSHAKLATGAKWGFGIGAAVGLVGGAAASADCSGCARWIPIAVAVYGAMGTGVGVGISAAIPTHPVIYSRSGTSSATLMVSPLVTRDRRGLSVAFGFGQ